MFVFLFTTDGWGQNGLIGNGFANNDWSTITNFTGNAGTTRILETTANNTGNSYFRLVTNWDSNTDQWGPNSTSNDYQVSPNIVVPASEIIQHSTTKAYYIDVSNTSFYYIFKTLEGGNPPSNKAFVVFEIQGTVQNVSSVSQLPLASNVDPGDAVSVTATLNGNFSTGQAAYLCYSTDDFSNSTVVQMTGSGTTYTASIPSGVNTASTTVKYYTFTSGTANVATDGSNRNLYTINWNDNSGSYYSYTVNNTYTTALDGDWETDATWTCNCDPPAGANVQINHDVDITTNVANNPASMEITTGNSITFGASGQIATTTLTNDGTIDMTNGGLLSISNGGTFTNNSTFTGGTGEVYFPGAATVSGTITFYNASLSGGVNFGANASIDNILQLYGGGYLDANSITYNSGSTLRYTENYTINSGDKAWTSGVASSGVAQKGVPWNIEINATKSLVFNEAQQYDMNGNLTINGSLTLGVGSDPFGDLAIRGDFINNGTFSHNSGRAVKFIGTEDQEIKGTQNTAFAYLEVNKPSGTLTVNSANTATIDNGYQLTLKQGDLELTATNQILGDEPIVFEGGNLITGTSAGYGQSSLGTIDVNENSSITLYESSHSLNFAASSGVSWTGGTTLTIYGWTGSPGTGGTNGKIFVGTDATGLTSNQLSQIVFDGHGSATILATGEIVPAIYTVQNGYWSETTTWAGGNVPISTDDCSVMHHVTVASIGNAAKTVTIANGKSITFHDDNVPDAALDGDELTVTNIINNGMVKTDDATGSLIISNALTNNSGASLNMTGGGTLTFADGASFTVEATASFTSGSGTVVFQGAGTASGTLAFNNLILENGNVDLGGSASLNGTMTLKGAGDLVTNSIKYEIGSTLLFARDYTLTDDKIWYRNNEPTGSASFGVPWNVEIVDDAVNTWTINSTDNNFRGINGNLTINPNSTFALSSSAGGDLKIRGDFYDNGTFTHNNRYVEFKGSTLQKISGSPTFFDLTINNNANVLLENNVTIDNNVNFTNGKLILGANNLTVTGSINTPSSARYIVTNGTGSLIQTINVSSNKFYPIGTMTGYNPANLSQGASATAHNIGVKVQNSIDNTVEDPTQIVNVQWTLNDATAGTNDLTTQFYWNGTDETSGFNRASGTIETRYYSSSYLPNSPTGMTANGTDPYDVSSNAADVFTGSLSNTPFIVANNGAFSGGIFTIASGNWNAGTTWNGGTVPVTGNCAIIKNGHTVTLTSNPTVKSISIENGGTLDCVGQTITLDDGGAIANSGTFNAGTGKVVFSGAGSISSGSIVFNDVDLDGAVSFGSSTTINGILTLNAGGSVNTNAPIYGAASTLKYNQGGNVARGYEWQYNIAESDPGYPANVQISNNTVLDVDADNNDDDFYNTRFLKGNLTIDAGSTISLGDMGGNDATEENKVCGVYAGGNIINQGTIELSTTIGGDMMLEGDLINTNATNDGESTITWNGRAIFFTGANNTDQYVRDVSEIPFILITGGSNVILDNQNISETITINGSGNEFLSFARPSSTNTGSIDLNMHTLTCNGDGEIELSNITGAEITGTGRVEVTGDNNDITFSGTSSGSLSFGPNVTLAKSGSGSITFPNTLGIVTIYGTLEIGDNSTINNIPTYGASSTLHYRTEGTVNVGVEWGPGENVADNIPFNVTISKGYPSGNASTLTLSDTRTALGTLTVQEDAIFKVAAGTGQLTVDNLTVEAKTSGTNDGEFRLKSPSDNGAAGSLITTGTVTNNGTMIAERFVPADKFVYLTAPSSQSSEVFTTHPGGFNPNFYTYDETFAAPSDPADGTYAQWDTEINNFSDAWIYAHDGSGGTGITLNSPGTGYAYYNDMNKTFEFDGAFYSGNETYTVTVTLTYNANDGNSGYFDGWNLIANPFPSALDWDDANWDKSNVDAAIYYWDGTTQNEGSYKYYVSSGTYDDGTDVVSGGSQMIPAGQAFFVKAKPSGGNLTIPNAARVHSTQHFWAKGEKTKENSKSANGFIRLQVKANNMTDELVARYIPEGTVEYDGQYDAYKMYSFSPNIPQIYSYNTDLGAGFALNSLPVESMNNILPIGFAIESETATAGQIILTESNMPNKHIYLHDVEENKTQNLLLDNTYNFVEPDDQDTRGRFYINYEDNSAPIVENNIEDYVIDFGQNIECLIPSNTFYDENLGDELSFHAKLTSGETLPEWLIFNSNSLQFSGLAPNATEISILLTATDIYGESVSDEFIIRVNAIPPTVSTDEVVEIFTESAIIKGSLVSAGGVEIEEVGVCWSENELPTLENNYLQTTLEGNQFVVMANNLTANTHYFARTYAKNSAGISYGKQLTFKTLSVVNVEENIDESIIYPNPTNNYIFVKNVNNFETLKIIDVKGNILLKKQLSNEISEIDISNFANGFYIVCLVSESDTKYIKLIKK